MVPKRIAGIRFEILSPQEIRRMSVAKIVSAETYDDDGFPIEGGLMDPRLGVIDPGLRCKTCGGKAGECPGHFGHIELAAPVIHVGYAKLIAKLLNATCRECGRLRLPDKVRDKFLEEIEKRKELGQDYEELVKEVYRRAKAVKKCPHCGTEAVEVKFEKPTFYYIDEHKLTPLDVREWLEKIPDEDLPVLGIDPKACRPEWLVITVLPVPPVTVRPSIILETGQRSEDDLTHKLVDIIRINQRFLENKEAGAPHLILEDLWELLQYHVTTYINNEVSGIPPARHRSGRPLKTLAQRLKGKEGRFRGSLSGKRVNFSARTVISPDPCISINEVGVPYEIAEELTVPIHVTERNIDEAREYILRTEHPKANYVVRPDGRRIRVMDTNREELAEKLEPGWIVERQLKDGDIVLFNRQPSLHRMSIMAHYVRVLPGKTFRLNPAVCVSGDTKVLLDGVQMEIERLDWKNRMVSTSDGFERTLTKLTHYWKLKAKDYGKICYRIVTETGREIVATEDHPFYTSNGVKPAGKLEIGDEVVVYPMDFPSVEVTDGVVVTEEDVVKIAGNSRIKKIIRELKERNLIPLKLSDPRITAIARLVGHIFGDGSLIIGKNSRAVFRAKPEDLEDIIRDIRMLGYEPGKVIVHECENKIRKANGEILEVKGKGYSVEVRKKSFCLLLKALGCPDGDKVKKAYGVPEWIKRSPKFVKKEFLSSYFGSELTKPILRKSCRKLFKELTFKVAKVEEMLDHGMKFVEDVREILREFGIETSVRVENSNVRKDGSRTKIITVSIKSQRDFFGKIGYSYNREAEKLARLAYGYLTFKEVYLRERNRLLKEVLNAKRGEVVQIANSSGKSLSALYSWRQKKPSFAKTSNDFPNFEEWVAERHVGGGFIKERIVKIEPTEVEWVYDITTEMHTHNFIANGFLTGNCPPYNADFDGDEMNLHVPQSLEAQAEAKILMAVQQHILSPRFGGPIIGGIHDHISGLYLLTRGERLFTKEEVMYLLGFYDLKELPEPKVVKDGKKYWTGKQIFSVILPDISLEFKAEICRGCGECKKENCEYDAYVVIKNGELIKGTIDEKAVGAFKGIIIDEIVRKYGNDKAKEFIDNLTHLAIRAIMLTGFTIGIDDEDLPEEAIAQVKEIIREAEKRVMELIKAYREGNLEPMPGRSLEETLEVMIMRELGRARDRAGRIAEKFLGYNNPAVIMAVSGARGSMLNLTQMSACIGQQSVRGERINRGYTYTNRTLPHFKPGDLSARARGFVESSYKRGLNPIEFFFHAMGGREGLVDTACRTSISGYLQRRMINALQDIKVEYDGTVREQTSETVVQFRYGEDGVDPMKSFRGKSVDIDRIVKEIMGG